MDELRDTQYNLPIGTDCINRQAAIEALCDEYCGGRQDCKHYPKCENLKAIQNLPSAQPEIKPIEYRDCANAMLEMWMDNVVTDEEYNRIMDKLNAHWRMENGRSGQ
jgi:hypothetical protein